MYKCSYGKCKCEYLIRTAGEDHQNVYMCPFARCVKKDGWLADKDKGITPDLSNKIV